MFSCFSIFCMMLEGMVGHKMGPAAIPENSDFLIIAAFYVQKSPFCQYIKNCLTDFAHFSSKCLK